MSDKLEDLVRKADMDLTIRMDRPPGSERGKAPLPRFSVAIVIWLVFVLIAAFEFDTLTSAFTTPGERQIEQDLEHVLNTAAGSLERYETVNGVLPPILPNPAIRGLVHYQRESDFAYTLTATIDDVTMIKTSSRLHPYRQGTEDQ